MCHVLLFAIPFLGLPLFWFLPLPQAGMIYGAIMLPSIFLYWKIYQALRVRVFTGREALVGVAGKVLKVDRRNQATVEVGNEIWSAESAHSLRAGQPVIVRQINGLELIVEPAGPISPGA